MNQKIRFFTLLIAISLLLAGCTIKLDTTINSDGSGEWTTEFGFNDADIAELSDFEMTVDEFCNDPDMMADMPPGAEVSMEERDGETWCIFVTPFSSLDELRQTYEEGDGITVNRLEIVDGQFFYDIDIDMDDEGSGELEEFEFEFTWQLTTPGNVTDTNANNVSGNTLTWDLTPGQVTNLFAESSTSSGLGGLTSGGGVNMAWIAIAVICLCGLGIVVIGIGIAVFFVIRKKKAEPVEEE